MGSPPPEGTTAHEQGPAAPGGETGVGNGDQSSPLPLRRSGRARKRPSDESENADHEAAPSTTSPVSADIRRNQKRKAAPETFDIPDDLLDASLGPWRENEQSEWPSWIELESDPAFFSAILGLLGVKGARIEEVLSADEDSLAMLPPPVYGLVFLYEYVAENSSESSTPGQDVWFANQTTDNACATIALLNIIMNAEGLGLGEKLRRLKEESKDLSPPLRGNMITNSAWIRTAHNSFARRLDFLNAALSLQNDVDSRKKRAKSSAKQKRKEKREKAKEARSGGSTAYHFIAFVPVGQQVWQLDGLTSAPVRIGEYSQDQHWTAVMHPVLQERMMRYETERLSFSLLALCGDNLSPIRQRLADNIRSLADLEAKLKNGHNSSNDNTNNNPELEPKAKEDDIIHSPTDSRLASYQLDASDIAAASPPSEPNPPKQEETVAEVEAPAASNQPNPPAQQGPTSDTAPTSPPSDPNPPNHQTPSPSPDDPATSWSKLAAEQRSITDQYDYESRAGGLAGQEPAAILGRTKDYTGAVHEWVRKLAEQGVLRRLHEEVEMLNGG